MFTDGHTPNMLDFVGGRENGPADVVQLLSVPLPRELWERAAEIGSEFWEQVMALLPRTENGGISRIAGLGPPPPADAEVKITVEGKVWESFD